MSEPNIVANVVETEDCILVGWSFTDKDHGVLIVGKQNGGKTDIINAFQDEEAKEIYKLLTTRRNKDNAEERTSFEEKC